MPYHIILYIPFIPHNTIQYITIQYNTIDISSSLPIRVFLDLTYNVKIYVILSYLRHFCPKTPECHFSVVHFQYSTASKWRIDVVVSLSSAGVLIQAKRRIKKNRASKNHKVFPYKAWCYILGGAYMKPE